MSGRAAMASSMLTTGYFLPWNSTSWPTDLAEATGSNSVRGNWRSASTFSSSVPTRPVAPTMASLITDVIGLGVS